MSSEAPTDTPASQINAPTGAPPTRQMRTSLATTMLSVKSTYTASPHHNNTAIFPRKNHNINVNPLVVTYSNILRPIVSGNFRAIGARTPTDQNDVILINAVVYTTAVQAVAATHAVGYHKAMKIDATSSLAYQNAPLVSGLQFPPPLAALIESFGPYETGATAPHRLIHVPIIELGSVQQLFQDPRYVPQYYHTFLEASMRSKLTQLNTVDVKNETSSPWWTLQPNHVYDNRELTSLNVFSPVPWEHLDTPSFVAAFYMDLELIEKPGIATFTATREYNLAVAPIRPSDFPPEARRYPYFDESQSTYMYVVEALDYTIEDVATQIYNQFGIRITQPPSGTTTQVPIRTGLAGASPAKKRKLTEMAASGTSVTTYMVKYFYYDHKLLNGINPSIRAQLATTMCT